VLCASDLEEEGEDRGADEERLGSEEVNEGKGNLDGVSIQEKDVRFIVEGYTQSLRRKTNENLPGTKER
jgi:hypothetical protein